VLPNLFGQRTKKRKMKVGEAFEYLVQEEETRLVDMDQVTRLAVERVENSGIIFLDEIDKIAAGGWSWSGRIARGSTERFCPSSKGPRQYKVRDGADGPYSLYRGGGVSRFEAERSDS